jgi:hypothetical protein
MIYHAEMASARCRGEPYTKKCWTVSPTHQDCMFYLQKRQAPRENPDEKIGKTRKIAGL